MRMEKRTIWKLSLFTTSQLRGRENQSHFGRDREEERFADARERGTGKLQEAGQSGQPEGADRRAPSRARHLGGRGARAGAARWPQQRRLLAAGRTFGLARVAGAAARDSGLRR